MKDETLNLVIPSITLGYAVKQDPCGRFMFFADDLEIVYRHEMRVARSKTDIDRLYDSLMEALQSESWRVEE